MKLLKYIAVLRLLLSTVYNYTIGELHISDVLHLKTPWRTFKRYYVPHQRSATSIQKDE